MKISRETVASIFLVVGLGLITAGSFGFGWRIGCIATGLATFAALTHLLGSRLP